jgi:hypothetical protein
LLLAVQLLNMQSTLSAYLQLRIISDSLCASCIFVNYFTQCFLNELRSPCDLHSSTVRVGTQFCTGIDLSTKDLSIQFIVITRQVKSCRTLIAYCRTQTQVCNGTVWLELRLELLVNRLRVLIRVLIIYKEMQE